MFCSREGKVWIHPDPADVLKQRREDLNNDP